MKLSEIEAVAEVVKEETSLEYGEFMSEDSQGLPNLPVGSMLYSAEQMQEYAKANCWELINWYVETTGDVNHAAEMKIWMDDEFGGHEK